MPLYIFVVAASTDERKSLQNTTAVCAKPLLCTTTRNSTSNSTAGAPPECKWRLNREHTWLIYLTESRYLHLCLSCNVCLINDKICFYGLSIVERGLS